MTKSNKKIPLCPICKKPTVKIFRPFCSDRCKKIDLSRWLSGVYAIPSEEDSKDEEEKKEDQNDS